MNQEKTYEDGLIEGFKKGSEFTYGSLRGHVASWADEILGKVLYDSTSLEDFQARLDRFFKGEAK